MTNKTYCSLEAETRHGFAVSAEMKRVWNVEIDLLMRLIEVCDRLGLRCWVADGTLLGAVRHGGFIPWDNDIDVCMLREDYDRLVEAGPQAFSHPYFLQTAFSDTNYFRYHAQLRNSETAAIRPSDSHRPFNQGIFIDIFPLDAVPEDEKRLQHVVHSVRRTVRFLKTMDTPILLSGRIGLLFRKWHCKREVKKRGWTEVYRTGVDDVLRATDIGDCRYVAEIGFSGSDHLFDKHIFDKTVMLDFEQASVPAPAGYEAYLRAQYGDDYMTPRQVSTAHDDALFDTEKSYTELLPLARRMYLKKQLQKLFCWK
ncbi:MAG: LicD family protein [Bacteroidaceae bacterium]|nr:LicD family protein [Bacteroidaceae bacterium]